MNKKRITTPGIESPVWFFLIQVRVTGHVKQPWQAGSKAVVQAFVPGDRMEDCLAVLDAYLPTEELERIDTFRSVRFEPGEEIESPGSFFLEPLEKAAATKECVLGVFMAS